MIATALLTLSLTSASAAPANKPTSVLVLPIEASGDSSRAVAGLLTSALAQHAASIRGYSVLTMREVETSLSQEQLRQVAGCESVSCAAEIAGALNTDEVVLGSVGYLGEELVLTLSRVRAKDSSVLGRSFARGQANRPEGMLDQMPDVVGQLFGKSVSPLPRMAPVASSSSTTASTGFAWRRALLIPMVAAVWIAGGAGLLTAVATLAGSALTGVTGVGLMGTTMAIMFNVSGVRDRLARPLGLSFNAYDVGAAAFVVGAPMALLSLPGSLTAPVAFVVGLFMVVAVTLYYRADLAS